MHRGLLAPLLVLLFHWTPGCHHRWVYLRWQLDVDEVRLDPHSPPGPVSRLPVVVCVCVRCVCFALAWWSPFFCRVGRAPFRVVPERRITPLQSQGLGFVCLKALCGKAGHPQSAQVAFLRHSLEFAALHQPSLSRWAVLLLPSKIELDPPFRDAGARYLFCPSG